jgi:hypothetical protein
MPLFSKEVLTLRLILACDDDNRPDDADDDAAPQRSHVASHLLRLPVEIRFEILQYLLCIDCNRKAYTRHPPQHSVSELLYLNPRRILEAAPFKHKGTQEINGSLPILKSCKLHPAILRANKQLYVESRMVFFRDNRVLAIQSNIKSLGAKFKNYGVPVLGPFKASKLIGGPEDKTQSDTFRFTPLILFTAGWKPDAPFYICSHVDAADFMHALWILVKTPFARGMTYSVKLSSRMHFRHLHRTDCFFKLAVLPWLHPHISSVDFHLEEKDESETALSKNGKDRLESIKAEFHKHRLANNKETNLHLYKSICEYLERILLQGELCIEQGKYITGELTFERVCYEACSLVRTRTSALVDVSARTKEGINRICKLIAVSAFRLCELRSGAYSHLLWKREEALKRRAELEAEARRKQDEEDLGETWKRMEAEGSDLTERDKAVAHAEANARQKAVEESGLPQNQSETAVAGESSQDQSSTAAAEAVDGGSTPETVDDGSTSETDSASGSSSAARRSISGDSVKTETPEPPAMTSSTTAMTSKEPRISTFLLTRTSRLDTQAARELALTSGLLALRLPCASPVPEWNIRLDIMLLRLFAWRNDASNATWSIRRIHNNVVVVMNGVKQKNKANEKKWEPFNALMEELATMLKPPVPKICFFEVADKIEGVVADLWGDRLMPKKGFNGLIWTFRWAG